MEKTPPPRGSSYTQRTFRWFCSSFVWGVPRLDGTGGAKQVSRSLEPKCTAVNKVFATLLGFFIATSVSASGAIYPILLGLGTFQLRIQNHS